MIFQKLTLNHLISFVSGTILLGFMLYCGRIGFESMQKSLAVDESSLVSGSAQLNKKSLESAIKILDDQKEVKIESEKEEVKREEENEEEKENKIPKSVEIINASGINGAASKVSEVFDVEKTEVILKNGEELLDETDLFYKNEYRSYKIVLEDKLRELGYFIDNSQEIKEDEEFDIRVVLGRIEEK